MSRKLSTVQWLLLILSMLMMTLFVRLGLWQIQRAEQKEWMQQSLRAATNAPPKALETLQQPRPYQKVQLRGRYLNKRFLWDNQFRQHQFGYQVLTPFLTEQGKVLLVNRGWLSGDATRHSLPDYDIPEGPQNIIGQIWMPGIRGWNIGPQIEVKKETIILEQPNPELTIPFLDIAPESFMIRLNEDQANGFVREWAEQTMTPQRHYGYAFQWFAMALTLLIIDLYLLTHLFRHPAVKPREVGVGSGDE